MKVRVWMAAVLMGLLSGGCLTFETMEAHVTIRDDQSAQYVFVYRNLQSDNDSDGGQVSDFEELVKMWQGDQYLLDGLKEGRYVRLRQLTIEDGVLVGREEGLMLIDSLEVAFGPDSVIREEAGDDLVSTNGTFVPDSGWVEWPAGTRQFDMITRTTVFEPKSDFVKLFRNRTGK